MTIAAYPLQWPAGWRRFDTSRAARRSANFKSAQRTDGGYSRLTIAGAVERVLRELELMGVRDRQDVVISTNLPTTLAGLPRCGMGEPGDPGAAVYWQEAAGTRRVMAVDRYDRVADNLAAIAATLDAMRAIERHGGAVILERAFTGFLALPAPGEKRPWRAVLGIDATASIDDARKAWRQQLAQHHPDRGGDATRAAAINEAWAEAQEAIG